MFTWLQSLAVKRFIHFTHSGCAINRAHLAHHIAQLTEEKQRYLYLTVNTHVKCQLIYLKFS